MGMTQHRALPRFAPVTLQQWFRDRGGTRNPHGPVVVIWPDTVNNRFHTDVGVAAVEAVEAAGWQVCCPRGTSAAGVRSTTTGSSNLAERYLRRTLEQLRPWYRAGVPIVGIEPELALLERMGVETETLQAGCCGLAGSWGFEAGHYGISMECGEQGLLPAVRRLPLDHLVVANGFSCKTQIEQGETGRRALHLAQVLQMARHRGPAGEPGPRPERAYVGVRPRPTRTRRAARIGAVATGAALAAGGAVTLALGRP